MTSYELYEINNRIIADLKKLEPYINDLKEIVTTSNNSIAQIQKIIIDEGISGNSQPQISGQRKIIIAKFNAFILKFNMLESYENLLNVQNLIKDKKNIEFYKNHLDEFIMIDDLLTKLMSTTEKIYDYVKTRKQNLISGVISSIIESHTSYFNIQYTNKYIGTFIKRLEFDYKNEDYQGYEEIEIQFYNSGVSLNPFIEILNSTKIIYEELRMLFNVTEFELKIIKVESGSILEKILGEENIIKALGELLQKTIELIFKKFTDDGKLLRKKEVLVFLNDELCFIEKCKELGLEVPVEAVENIAKTNTVITGEILKMVSKSSKIRINDKTLSIKDEITDKYLLESKKNLLEKK